MSQQAEKQGDKVIATDTHFIMIASVGKWYPSEPYL